MNIDSKEMYEKCERYWEKVPATVDGMLGGFGFITRTDTEGSATFLAYLLKCSKDPPGRTRALDCGAGIGRITKNLLVNYFDQVDLIEQNVDFVTKAREFVNSEKVDQFFTCTLQNFEPAPNRFYDVIWCQWVLLYLTDDDLTQFLTKCKKCLNKNGLVIAKENISSIEKLDYDEEDGSFTRPHNDWLKVFRNAGFQLVRTARQPNFPKGLLPVQMYAFRVANDEQS